MMKSKEKYERAIRKACKELRRDENLQVKARELLSNNLTLEDIYLPLTLIVTSSEFPGASNRLQNLDVEKLMDRINEKLEALKCEEAAQNADVSVNKIERLINSDVQDKTGLRLLLEANPGGGKTVFSKRLVLAMLNDEKSFFQKYSEENNLMFNTKAMPILLSCKNVVDFSVDELESMSFQQLMYKLCVQSFGLNFSGITENEFVELIDSYESKNLCIILDGWDDIFDTEKEGFFCEKLNSYLEQTPNADIIITIRSGYTAPELIQPYSVKCVIRPLLDEEVRKFCEKWSEINFSQDQQRKEIYSSVSEQLLRSNEPQIVNMRKNPLSLSLLLSIVSKKDGRLPENKAQLFDELVKKYIYWSTKKPKGSLSEKSIRVFLAYIASFFTKNKKLAIDEDELLVLIKQAKIDLEGAFSEDIYRFEPCDILKELSHTGILARTLLGKTFSFSRHRQMQEYLTAYAILAQYAVKEYNDMPPIDIIEDKYKDNRWREVILFLALMGKGRLLQALIKRLISKVKENPDNDYFYTNMLFDLIVKGADIKDIEDKHKIYDLIFSEHITDQQIANIIVLVDSNNSSSSDFISYIKTKFADSVEKGDTNYGYALAIIEASIALQQGKSPFVYAEELMRSDKDVDIVAGSQILLIMSWCKYAKIINSFFSNYSKYNMASEWIELYKALFEKTKLKTILLKSIREAVLADFASFNDFFNDDIINDLCLQLNRSENNEDCELILSIVPVFDLSFQQPSVTDDDVKKEYLQNLNDEIQNKSYDKIIFTFNICAAIGCFSLTERDEIWSEIDLIYKNLNNSGYMGKARYLQLKSSFYDLQIKKLLEQLEIEPDTSAQLDDLANSLYLERTEQVETDQQKTGYLSKPFVYSDRTQDVQSTMKGGNEFMESAFFSVDRNGEKVKCEVLFTFESEDTEKEYIVYTDHSVDDDGNTRIYASIYEEDADGGMSLTPIETEKEWRIIETILGTIQDELRGIGNE